jgi:triphosphatase
MPVFVACYGREFFASLTLDGSHGKAGRKVDHALKRLQGALGDLNDMRAHAQRAQGFARANTASRKAFAAGVLIGRDDASAGAVLGKAPEAGKRLRRAA